MLQIGDKVQIECIGASAECIKTITDKFTRYDEVTGIPYDVYSIDGWLFDSRNGNAINPPTMYYIEAIE